MSLEHDLKAEDDRKLLNRLFNQVNSGGLGILGLDSTIRALQQGQVNFLIVQHGYETAGFRCSGCRSLSTRNGACDYCGSATQSVPDLVGEAVQEAITQGCQVKVIGPGESELSGAGKIGAMLRFKT
jgi:peptide chain release factor subunit 1